MYRRHFSLLLPGLLASLLQATPVTSAAATPEAPPKPGARTEITVSMVYLRVLEILHLADELRQELGRPQARRQQLVISHPSAREFDNQATSLFDKVNRLSQEQLGERADAPTPAAGRAARSDIYRMLGASVERLRAVADKFSVPPSDLSRLPPISNVTPEHVFDGMAFASRQVDLLLEHRIAPSAVYQQVTLALGYTSRLLETLHGPSLPPAPRYQSRRTPGDVFLRLLDCLERVQEIYLGSGLEVLDLKIPNVDTAAIEPGEVYDLASLLVVELRYLHSRHSSVSPPLPAFFPGVKVPADVFQRAGQLENGLDMLLRQVESDPNWLHNDAGAGH